MVFGSLSILASLVALFLPETRHKALPDSVREASVLGSGLNGKRNSKHKHTLLENNHQGSHSSLQFKEEPNYEKGPEWVEVRKRLFQIDVCYHSQIFLCVTSLPKGGGEQLFNICTFLLFFCS